MRRSSVSRGFALLALLVACSDSSLQVLVDVETALRPGADFDEVETDLFRGIVTETTPIRSTRRGVGASDDFEMGSRAAEFLDLEPGTYVVRARLNLRSELVAEQSLEFGLESSRGLTVRIVQTPPVDAGRLDGGPPDVGLLDAGRPDSGPTCAPSVVAEASSTLCSNGLDDDGDMLVDCADPTCHVLSEVTVCAETNCDNGIDDDRNRLADCDDPNCLNVSSLCGAGVESGDECFDGSDNDADGFPDCADSDCRYAPVCQESDCMNGMDDNRNGFTDCEDWACQDRGVCPGTESTNELCSDGIDNDENGFFDCGDHRCQRIPSVTVCEGRRSTCADGIDNDCDGFTDCASRFCAAFCPEM